MFKEFREFALKGSVIDLAVGIIIGGAFNSIVQSLVNDIIMPPFGLILGRVDFAGLFLALDGKQYSSLTAAKNANAPVIAYGAFINNVITFLILAFVIFLIVRQINRMRREPPKETNTKTCVYCFSTIPLQATRCPECTSELLAKEAIVKVTREIGS
jgi:large conductance mechanosensitive channel